MEIEHASKISELNDAFRTTGQGVTITSGVQALDDLYGLLEQVRNFDEWWDDSDPYGEHDFGKFMWGTERIFWKIDYYNKGLCYWEDPLSPRCQRIMTVMLASEY